MQPLTKNVIIFAVCAVSLQGLLATPPPGALEKDNETHRRWSEKLDDKFSGNAVYDKAARPLGHGTYHAARAVGSQNPAEWARAKDQYSKLGTGQQRTEYLKEHQALQRKDDTAKK